eukprot:scaffold293503_cov23-Tisochrysis_lutea.AAC.1
MGMALLLSDGKQTRPPTQCLRSMLSSPVAHMWPFFLTYVGSIHGWMDGWMSTLRCHLFCTVPVLTRTWIEWLESRGEALGHGWEALGRKALLQVSRMRRGEVWEGLAHALGVTSGTK